MPPGLKVVNPDDVGVSGSGTTGVSGAGISGSDPTGAGGSSAGIGVAGSGDFGVSGQGDSIGVMGGAGSGPGVYGLGNEIGVSGLGGVTGVYGAGTTSGVHGTGETGVFGSSTIDTGVRGFGQNIGVVGEGGPSFGHNGIGVLGVAGADGDVSGIGVMGDADTNGGDVGVWGTATNGWAIVGEGNCLIMGALVVQGAKMAATKLRNGEHRALYCMESPECWFEDFGRVRLVRGKARVRLDRTFAEVVRTGDYHVFLSPEGLSHGLYISRRTRNGFDVKEQQRGTSTVPFSYRIVARRKDVEAPRFKRVKPALPIKQPRLTKIAAPKLPEVPKALRTPQLEAILKRAKTVTATRGRRRTRGSRSR